MVRANERLTNSLQYRRIVRYSISTLISTIGRVVLPRAAGWKDLFPTLFQLANSADPTHRESALLTLEALEEHIGDLLEQHYGEFYELFKRSLSPQEAPIVQVAAIKCIGMLIPWLSDNEVAVNKFRDFIPLVVGVIQRAISQHKEDDAVAGFEVLQELAESPSAVLEPYILDLTNFVLQVGTNRDLDFNIRSEALTVIQWIAQLYVPKSSKKWVSVSVWVWQEKQRGTRKISGAGFFSGSRRRRMMFKK